MMYSDKKFKCVVLRFVTFLLLVALCLNFYPDPLSLDFLITIFAVLIIPFSVYLFSTHKKCVERQRKSLRKIEKEELTYQLVCEWIKLKDNIKAANVFVDKMVTWSKDKNKKKLVDFNLIRDFINSNHYYSNSLHTIYSQDLHELDENRSSSNDVYVKQRILIERMEFLLPQKQANAYT